ncbi:MAG: DUF5067 domain-containing protein [Liquorilactobacillus hordei]|uniref:DUF5067 domain-containing protein n=1 Tax=Liquorilactobacillus hordei TaxID=468911 RepID=UPI0039E83FCC
MKRTRMKKIGTVLAGVICTLSLVSCGNTSNKSSSKKASTAKTITVGKQQKYYFKNNVAEIHDIKIQITNVEIKTADQTNGYSDKPLIIFIYKVTNKTDKKIDPISAWLAVFNAYQDNDKNSVNELDIGSTIDEKYLDTQSEQIKKDGTVENEITYELSDMSTPVKLQATQGMDGKKLGYQMYRIKQ